MAKLRHIAMSVPDPWKAAEFYEKAFDMERVGETDSALAEGVYISDGVIIDATHLGWHGSTKDVAAKKDADANVPAKA